MNDCYTNQQGRISCTCGKLHTQNSDGTSPHAEARDTVEIALDFVLLGIALAALTFSVLSLLGFMS